MDMHGTFGDGVSFIQSAARTPRPWVNRLWNRTYMATCNQVAQGGGFAQDSEGNRIALHSGRMIYLFDLDTKEWWSANGVPLPSNREEWSCLHAGGIHRIALKRGDIASELSITVPRQGNGEWWQLRLTNAGKKTRRLRVFACLDTSLGDFFPGGIRAAYDAERQCVQASDVVRTGTHYAHYTDGRTIAVFMAMNPKPDNFDTSRRLFIGPYETLHNPIAIQNGSCSGSLAGYEKPILALQTTLDLASGAVETVQIVAGLVSDAGSVDGMIAPLFRPGGFETEVEAIAADIAQFGSTWKIAAGDAVFSTFVNGWLKHQLRFNATWARVYYYGFRDLCQDLQAVASTDKGFAARGMETVLAHQYASGYAPRAWVKGQLVEQEYADSPVWIAPAVHSILAETGDAAWLEKPVRFVDEGVGTIYEHVMRSLRFMAEDAGPHGLSRIRRGDWNDLLNGVGKDGKGESVWLSQALVVSLEYGAKLAAWIGRKEDAAWAEQMAVEMRRRINVSARVDDLFIRAFTDAGAPVCAPGSGEGIDLLPQAWAVISGCVSGADAIATMEEVDALLEEEMGTRTVERGFHGYRDDIGYQSVVPPGYNTNAGCYNHAAAFAVVADFMAGRPDAAWRRMRKILPWTEARGRLTGEPFVINNGYHSSLAGERAGDSDTGWITGTAGWLCRAILEHAYGLVPTLLGLRLRPCLPAAWGTCRIERTFRDTRYVITYADIRRDVPGAQRILIDGRVYEGDYLPGNPGGEVAILVE